MNFNAINCSAAIAGIVRNAVEMQLFEENHFEILEHQQVDKLLAEQQGLAERCNDGKCLHRLGRLLKAGYMVTGTVEKLDTYRITVRVFEVKSEKLIVTASADAESEKELRGAAEEAAGNAASGMVSMWRGSYLKIIDMRTGFIFAFPMGHLGNLCSYGYGFDLQGEVENIFIRGFFAGGLFSFIYYAGEGSDVHHSWMTALQVSSGYALSLGIFRLRFYIAGGMGYNRINYYQTTDTAVRGNIEGLQPVMRTGIDISMKFWKYLWCSLGAGYGHIFDAGGGISWVQLQGNITVRF